MKTNHISVFPNPIAQFRLDHFLSQDGMAEICGVSRQIIQGAELGVFETIPPSIINGLLSEYAISPTALQAKYSLWIREQLNAVNVNAITSVDRISTINAPDIVHTGVPVGIKTFRQWRKILCESNGYSDSYSGLSKLIKIQPVIIRKYEQGKTKSFPAPLATRLRFWGYPENYLSELAGLPIGKAD